MYSDISAIFSILSHRMSKSELLAKKMSNNDNQNHNQIILKCEVILTPSFNKEQHPSDQEDIAANQSSESTIELPEIKTSADDAENEDPTTPTSPDQRIPEIRPCPPAPKKPKSKPASKRKYFSDERVVIRASNSSGRLLDFSKEVESMFPPLFRANFNRKIKKARSL